MTAKQKKEHSAKHRILNVLLEIETDIPAQDFEKREDWQLVAQAYAEMIEPVPNVTVNQVSVSVAQPPKTK